MHGAERNNLDAGCSALSHAHRWRTPGALVDLRRYQCLSCSCSILPPPSILPPTRDASPNAGNGHHLPVHICTTGHHHHISWPWLCLRQFHQVRVTQTIQGSHADGESTTHPAYHPFPSSSVLARLQLSLQLSASPIRSPPTRHQLLQ